MMDELLNKLSEDQAQVALEIARKAKEMGIDPKLAVAVAYRESRLNPNTKNGTSGEIGLMQVMPKTAEGMGFSVDDLRNPAKNIEIGLTYLKQGLDKFGDPMLAVAGYNAGHNHPYFADPENRSLPDSTKEYLREINQNGGFAEPEAEEAPPQTVDTPASEEDFAAQKAQLTANALAAGSGAGIAKTLDVAKNVGDTMAAFRTQKGALPSVPAPQAAPSPQGAPTARPVAGGPAGPVGGPSSPLAQMGNQSLVPTDPMHTRQMQGTTESGATGRARQSTYNEQTSQLAAQKRAQENVMAKLRQQNVIGSSADDILAKMPGMTATPSGILMPSSAVYPQAPSAPPPPLSAPPAPPQPGALSQAGSLVKKGAGAVLNSPVTMGALGGLSVLESGGEAISRTKAGDPTGANIAAAGGVGGVMQMMPLPLPLKAIGAAVAAASPLTLYLRDKINNQTPMPEATPAEMLEAQSPAFRYARP
jgi:hypothetical protein